MSIWFMHHRVDWIIEIVQIYGFINRSHIRKKFGISAPQATFDIKEAMRLRPNLLRYDKASKTYRLNKPDVEVENDT